MAILQWIFHNIPSVIAVCVAFGFIIAIHELGHFLMARRVGIRCPRFSLGFGPRLFSFWWRGTEFTVCLLPLGGYVSMLGEEPDSDEAEEDFNKVSTYLPESALPGTPQELAAALEKVAQEPGRIPEQERDQFRSVLGHVRYLPPGTYKTMREVEGNFNDKSIWGRMATVVGGVTMNFISALIMFWIIGACYGLAELSPQSLPIVMKVFDNSPAARAGLEYGDRIEKIEGQPVVSGTDMVRLIARYPAQPVSLEVSRGQEKLQVEVTPNLTSAGVNFVANDAGLPQVVSTSPFGKDCPTQQFKVGDVVISLDGQPIHNLAELQKGLERVVEENSQRQGEMQKVEVAYGLQDKRQVKLAMFAEELRPEGKIGIMPAQVTEFKFNDTTTNLITAVASGSLGAREGFQAGDYLYLVNGALISNLQDLQQALQRLAGGSEPIVFDLLRGSEHVRLQLTGPIKEADLGLTFQPVTFGLAFKQSFVLIGRLIIAPVIIIQQLADKVLSPDLVKSSMSGPLGIMQMIFELSSDGLGKFLYVVALINAAVGAFNIIPFPALDGARLLVLLVGAICGKELNPRTEALVHNIGLYLLLGLVLLVTYVDIMRMWAGVPLTQ